MVEVDSNAPPNPLLSNSSLGASDPRSNNNNSPSSSSRKNNRLGLPFIDDMAVAYGGRTVTDDGGPPSSSPGRRTYRKKHALRGVFRSASLILLVGGFALFNYFGGNGSAGSLAGHGNGALRSAVTDNNNLSYLKNSVELDGQEGSSNRHRDYTFISRFLEGEGDNEDGGNDASLFTVDEALAEMEQEEGLYADPVSAQAAASKEEPVECPKSEVADPTWLAVFYAIGVLYMFLALAIVCDEFFVPALEEISCEHHLNLSMDVAGATLMAAGGSAPELFTSFVGTFQQSDIGIGTIVGSAVFNVLFVIGMCSILSKEVLTLTWWPLFRDTSYYAVGLLVLSILAGVASKGMITWWESVILLSMYLGYVLLMYFNRKLYTLLTGKTLVLAGEDEETDDTPPATDADDSPTNGATVNGHTVGENGEKGENGSSPTSSDGFVDQQPAALAASASSPASSPKARESHNNHDFRWPGTFRAGVLKLLLHPENWEEKAGLGIVAKMQGDVDHVFKQIDINGDGDIDQEELGNLFEKLGHDIGEEELGDVFASLDLDGNGTICEEEFSKWYIKSEERILSKVKPIFDTFDADKNGSISRDEVKELLKTLEPRVTDKDVDDAINAMYKSGSTEEITYEEFADWYVHSIIYTRQQTLIEKQIEEEAAGVCDALKPPKGEGFSAWLKYLLVLPLVGALTLTIPDVRRPGQGKWCYLAFIISIAWIGGFSYFMVSWADILGSTIGIPSVVMGYTVLAAGTSVPDLISSVIVARMGEGDMAVSSSIGSNIFDILVGLPLPWLVFTLWPTTPDVVIIQAQGIWISIFILIGMLVAIIVIVHCQGWKMTRTLGGIMFMLYFAFLVQAIYMEYRLNDCA